VLPGRRRRLPVRHAASSRPGWRLPAARAAPQPSTRCRIFRRAGPTAGRHRAARPEHGSAPLTTTLATGRAWELRWSFDCSTSPAGTGSFAVDLDGPGPARVDEHGAHGDGTEHLAPGAYRLTVHSRCPWTLTVITT
jgi:hypothetical protein